MTIYGRKINDDDMMNIAGYMDDDIREELHSKLAPCTHEEFIRAYLDRDPDFLDLLESEFDFCDDDEEISNLAEELLDFTEETFCEWTDEAKKRGYEHIESYLNDYAHGLNESREWGLNEAETDTVVEVAIQKYEKERCYYWLDTDYHYGDYNVKKWAMIRGRYTEDGEKDRDTEEVIAWGPIPDTDDMDEAWRLTDEAIVESLGFLPDYEVN